MFIRFNKKKITTGNSPTSQTWRRFKKNRWAWVSLYLMLACIIIAILGYGITPDNTIEGNRIIPSLAFQKPWSKNMILRLPNDKQHLRWVWLVGDNSNYSYYVLDKYAVVNDTLYMTVFLGEGLQDTLIKLPTAELYTQAIANLEQAIYVQHHWLGTDNLGRDTLTRLMLGLRISLSVGLVAVFISLTIGILLGAIAGYYGGPVDKIIQWLINVIWAIPTVLLVFALTIVLGKGFWQIFIAVGLTIWVSAARLIRGQVMAIKQEQYIEAAHSLGFGSIRIIFKHILPNIIGPILVIAASNFATAILLEAGLSFLGIGVQPPAPSWGSMIRDYYGYIVSDRPYLALIPGFAIMFLVLLLNLIGNGLRDALDVKTKLS